MKSTTTKPHPFVQRGRPIDATGLFWSLVFVLSGCFYAWIFFGRNEFIFAGVICVGLVSGVVWQFRKWKRDALIHRQATEWCRHHYPEFDGTPVVDFLVAMAHILAIDFRTLKPSSLLVDLAKSPDGINVPPFDDLSDMLECMTDEPRIPEIDWSSFSGSTVDDAVQFVVRSSGNTGNTLSTM